MITPPWFDELAEFLSIPSVSADPARAADVRDAGQWVCDLVGAAGGDCTNSCKSDADPSGCTLTCMQDACPNEVDACGAAACN